MKKVLCTVLAMLLLACMMAACGSTPASSGQAASAPAGAAPSEAASEEGGEPAAAPAGSDLVVGMIANAFGTQSYNDDVLAGLKKAEAEFGTTTISIEVPEVADTANSMRTLISQGVNFMVVPSSDYRDALEEIAPENPDVKFLYLVEPLEGYDNIMSVVYRENEASFLAGAMAGMLTQTNNIGAVMAVSEPLQIRFQYGYMAGAQAVNPDCQVQTAFTNVYTDVNKGAEVASAMYSKGADWVSTFAGACNLGVFNAAQDAGEGKYCFGAATGQFDKMPDKIIASVVKPVDEAIVMILGDYISTGEFDTSAPLSMGLKENGVTLLFNPDEALVNEVVPQDVRDALDDLRAKVESGEIVVPGTEEDFKTFTYTYEK